MYNHFSSGDHSTWSSPPFTSYGTPTSSSSSSSLAMALDESAMQTRRSVQHEEPLQYAPTYTFGQSYHSPAIPENSENENHCGIGAAFSGFSDGAASWIPNGMCFPETAYETQYAATYDKQAVTCSDEYGQGSPYQQTQADCLTIDGGMSGMAYMDGYNTLSVHSGYTYAFDYAILPMQDEPIVLPAPPTAAQISRSSTLADAMTLPLALRTPQPPPSSSPNPTVTSPSESAPKSEQAEASPSPSLVAAVAPDLSPDPIVPDTRAQEPSIKAEPSAGFIPTTVASVVTPEARVDVPPKKRSSKATGRPRGRPPKSLLTSVPRDKVIVSSAAESSTASESGTCDDQSSSQNTTSPQDDTAFPADGEHPGQSTFMLDTAVPEPPKKKPIMACLFCRERKIGCGPPPPEQEDQTCKQCKRRGLICEWPTECRRGQHKRGPRKKRDAAALEEGDATGESAGTSSSAPKAKRKADQKLTSEELERRQAAADVQAVTERQTALKRQRKLAAAQHKRLVEMRVIEE